jgi:hypothetical protein
MRGDEATTASRPRSDRAPRNEHALRLARGSSYSPGPSFEQLEAWADLIAHVRVVNILWADDADRPHRALLRPYRIVKGRPHFRIPALAMFGFYRIIEVKMRRIKRDDEGRRLAGEWSDGYRVGDNMITHLVWDPERDGYITLAWNAVWQIP